jgi:predicted RNA methylase
MPDFTWLVIFFIAAVFLLIVLFNGLFYGAQYTKLDKRRLKRIIELGKLKSSMTVYDLGAGYGRIMFEVAKSKAKVVGYEVDPAKAFWIRQQISRKSMNPYNFLDISIVQGNLLNADLSQADVVYCYLSPPLMKSLGTKAVKEMRQGTKLISVEYKIPNLSAAYADVLDKIYVYQF